MKIVVGASSFGGGDSEAQRILERHNVDLVLNPYGRKLTKEETIAHLQDADGLLAGLEPLDEDVFQKCPHLKAIARIGIGMDNVDREAAEKHGIKVSNTPDGPTQAVAEMTLTALLTICHSLILADRDIHRGIWKKRMGYSIREMKILVIGYGRIGRAVSGLLNTMGAEVMIYDKFQPEDSTCGWEEGLKEADVITLHASGTDEIISDETFHHMKGGVILLNSARGGLVNEQALFEALKSGKVSAFWGDALWQEPYNGIVSNCDNAILTPHICTYTRSCRESMERQAVENLLRDLGMEGNNESI